MAVIIDLYSRRIIGWSISHKNNAELVQDALTMAILRRGRKEGVVVDSDLATRTYASGSYQRLLEAELPPIYRTLLVRDLGLSKDPYC